MYFEKFCKSCVAETHCCKFKHNSGFTFVGIADAKRIRAETGKKFSEFLDYTPLSASVVRLLKTDDPLLEGGLRYSQLDKKNRLLRLKKQENGDCVFLSSTGKCSIYSIRPHICDIYPFWGVRLMDGSVKVVDHDVRPRCPIVKSMRKKDGVRPLSQKQTALLTQTFEQIEEEDVYYRKHIKRFSKGL